MITLTTQYKWTKSTHRMLTEDIAIEIAKRVITSASVVSVEVKDENGKVLYAENHKNKEG